MVEVDRVSIVETSVVAQIGRLRPPEVEELGQRLAGRFGWKAAGDMTVAETFELDEVDYDLTIEALGYLGIHSRSGRRLPSYQDLAESLDTAVLGELDQHMHWGDPPELTFHLPFRGGFYFSRLIDNFDRIPDFEGESCPPTEVRLGIWESYRQDEHKLGLGGDDQPVAAIALNDRTDRVDRGRPANDKAESGLVYSGQSARGQMEALYQEKVSSTLLGFVVDEMSFSQYLILQAKRRIAGLPPLDRETYTRFTNYPQREVETTPFVPTADFIGGRLELRGNNAHSYWGGLGVRRVIRIDP